MHFNQLHQYNLAIILCWFFLNVSFAAPCGDSEFLKQFMIQGDYRSALQEMDNCLVTDKPSSKEDLELFAILIIHVLRANDSTSFEHTYQNFQNVLSIHLFSELKFKFAHYFETHPKEEAKLFSKARQAGEKYYFYYDTGRLFSHSRGIALTNKSLIWKNLIGKPRRLAFDDIMSVALVYDRRLLNSDLSLTGWKLRINNDENNDIRLSRVSVKVIMPFFNAISYFIRLNQTKMDNKLMI